MEYEVEAAIHSQGSHPGMGYIYGMGKHVAHCMCKSVAANIGIDLLWPMITNAYGVGELSPRFVNTTLRKIINGEPLQFTAATQNYDFVYKSRTATPGTFCGRNGRGRKYRRRNNSSRRRRNVINANSCHHIGTLVTSKWHDCDKDMSQLCQHDGMSAVLLYRSSIGWNHPQRRVGNAGNCIRVGIYYLLYH